MTKLRLTCVRGMLPLARSGVKAKGGHTLAKIEVDILERDDAQSRRGGRKQSVVEITQVTLGEDHGVSTMHHTRPADHLAESYRSQKAHLELDRGGNWPRSKVMPTAGPMVASSICAMKPPAIPPAGLRHSGFGANSTAMVPRATSISTHRHPKNLALGGPGKRLWTKCHRGIISLVHRSSPSRCLFAASSHAAEPLLHRSFLPC